MMNSLVSWLYLCTIFVPIISYKWAKTHKPNKLWIITCSALGLIVSSFGFGLYFLSFYLAAFIHPTITKVIFGIAGAILFVHVPIGYKVAILLRIQKPGTILSGLDHFGVEVINGLFWSLLYGFMGFIIDSTRNRIKLMNKEKESAFSL